jgi:tRNA-dihydrouridine synthase
MQSFWEKLKKPIIGLSPMDGVTDAPFRHAVAKIGKPDVMFTEFVNVEGLSRGAIKLLNILLYSEIEHPIVAQLFGATPDDFYKATLIVCALGFDGVDINMGCPANNVAKNGGGAALIKNPNLAKKIIQAVKNGVDDWADGKNLKNAGISPEILKWTDSFNNDRNPKGKRRTLPISVNSHTHTNTNSTPHNFLNDSYLGHNQSRRLIGVGVKTRLGYDSDISEKWVSFLSEQDIDVVSLHGRTLKQMYQGQADWDAISKSAKVAHDAGKIILGNGDIKSVNEAKEKCEIYKVDGVLIGRATWGNPWFFSRGEMFISKKEKLDTLYEHALYFKEIFGEKHFSPFKKHIAHYVKNFDGAIEARQHLLSAKNFNEFTEMIAKIT